MISSIRFKKTISQSKIVIKMVLMFSLMAHFSVVAGDGVSKSMCNKVERNFKTIKDKQERWEIKQSKKTSGRNAKKESATLKQGQYEYLNSIMKLEYELRYLMSSGDMESKIDGLSPKEQKKFSRLCEKIKKRKTAHIKISLRKSKSSLADYEMKFRDIFEESVKKDLREREKLEKSLTQMGKGSSPNDQVRALEEKIETLRKKEEWIHRIVYGEGESLQIDQKIDDADKSDSGQLLREIVSERDRLFEALAMGGGVNAKEPERYRNDNIGGIDVHSSNLGVILDVSGSMTSFIPSLKKEIKKEFPDARYKEVVGCTLIKNIEIEGNVKKGYVPYFSRLFYSTDGAQQQQSTNTLVAVRELITIYKVDAIYWFCDLNDGENEKGLDELKSLLVSNNVKLYLKSVGRDASSELVAIVTRFKLERKGR